MLEMIERKVFDRALVSHFARTSGENSHVWSGLGCEVMVSEGPMLQNLERLIFTPPGKASAFP